MTCTKVVVANTGPGVIVAYELAAVLEVEFNEALAMVLFAGVGLEMLTDVEKLELVVEADTVKLPGPRVIV